MLDKRASLTRKLLAGSLVGIGAKVLGAFLAFLVFMVLARLLPAEQYGLFAAAFSAATILGFVATFGQQTAVLRFWPALDESHGVRAANRAILVGLAIVLTGGAIVFAASLLSSSWLPALTGRAASPGVVVWTGALAFAFALSEFCVASLRARGSLLRALVPREVLWRLLVIVVAVGLAAPQTGESVLALTALVLLAVTLPQLLSLAPHIRSGLRTALPAVVTADFRRASWGLWALSIADQVAKNGATIIVGLALGPASAATFFVAERFARLLGVALVGVNQLAGPMLARSLHAGRKNEVDSIGSAATALAFALALAGFIVFVLFGKFGVSLFGADYEQAYLPLLALGSAQLVAAAGGPSTLLLSLGGQERLVLSILAVWAFAGLAALWICASAFGLPGAAMASAAATAGLNLHLIRACHNRLGFRPSLKALLPGQTSLPTQSTGNGASQSKGQS